jgi:hypothetical protein
VLLPPDDIVGKLTLGEFNALGSFYIPVLITAALLGVIGEKSLPFLSFIN